MSAPVRCPHCKAELPEKASFCASCGRRIEGWSLPKDATPAGGAPALPGGEEATRQMSPTPSLLRAAAVSVKKPPTKRRSLVGLPLVVGMVVIAIAGGFAAFFFVRARVHKHLPPKPPLAVTPPAPAPPPAPVPLSAPAPPTATVRKSKSGKRAHVIASTPVPVKAPHAAAGGLPHKQVATDSKPLTTATATPMPTVQHESAESSTPAPPTTTADDKQQAEATLDADSVRFVVRQHLPQVRACYSRAFKDSSPGGSVEIGFAIDPTGRAKNVRAETNTTDSEGLAHCLETRVREWQFPRPVGGDYELIYPFVFAPGS